jgi:cysteine desulfurase family protein (TIGR01976 family)
MDELNLKFKNLINCREDFPSLRRTLKGRPLAYFDGPAGTQVPQQVIHSIANYYKTCNANAHAHFITSIETDQLIDEARTTMAIFLGAEGEKTISFGANMTTLNFSLSKAIGRYLQPGDEILITQLDHEANRGPWLALRDEGVVVREVAVTPQGVLDYEDFEQKINEKTRLVAMGYASNAFGTVNNVSLARKLSYQVGAWLLLDAVHYAPHFPTDLRAMGVDFFLCSAYKFYGPHVGVLYCREGLLDRIHPDRLRTQIQQAPFCIETGTPNFASIAGTKAAVEYIASFGTGKNIRSQILSSMETIAAYEHELAKTFWQCIREIPNLKVQGPSFDDSPRCPTISFTIDGITADNVCTALGEKGICAWSGHFYAIRPIEVLGLLEKGGVTRIGISMYNTIDEVQRLVQEIKSISAGVGLNR